MLLVMDVKSTISSYNKPLAPRSPHVAACDDLVSPKHDQAISRAVSVHPDSNGRSLSICRVLKPERFAALCIFSSMNSFFPIFFSLSLNPFPTMPGFCLMLGGKRVLFKHGTLTSDLHPMLLGKEGKKEMQVL